MEEEQGIKELRIRLGEVGRPRAIHGVTQGGEKGEEKEMERGDERGEDGGGEEGGKGLIRV